MKPGRNKIECYISFLEAVAYNLNRHSNHYHKRRNKKRRYLA